VNDASAARFGISVPQVQMHENPDPGEISRLVEVAERARVHSLWVADGQLTPGVIEAWTLLTHVGALSRTVRLGTSVLVLPWRSPLEVAKASASLDRLANGRVILGVGLGGGDPRSYRAFGLSPDERVARFEESIELMKHVWSGSLEPYRGQIFELDGAAGGFTPEQQPGIPIWFGGGAPRALRRAVAMGDGWMGAGSSPLAKFRASLEVVRTALEQANRQADSFALSKRMFVHVTHDVRRTRQRLSEWSAVVYSDPDLIPECAVIGDADHCAAHLSDLLSIGLDLILIDPILDIADQAELLVQDVFPQVTLRPEV